MARAGQRRQPDWLDAGDAPRAFRLAVCTRGDLDAALARIDAMSRGAVPLEQGRPAPGVAVLGFDGVPAAAWSLLQALERELDDCDLCLRPADAPPIRLLICDMDMTIVAAETLDEVAARLGLGERIAVITARAMRGEIDFDGALRERMAMLAGEPAAVFDAVAGEVELNPGAAALIEGARAAGVYTILVSGGFAPVAEAVARRLGFDEVVCNPLDVAAGKLTGKVADPIVNAARKAGLLRERAATLGIELAEACAIGDGANDLPMLEAAGLGIAYHGKPVLRAAADCRIDATDLSTALHFLQLGGQFT